MIVFVLLMLSTVTFDGFKETPLHADILKWIASEPLFHTFLLAIHELGFDLIAALDTVMLALSPLLFFLVYLGSCWLAKEVSDSELRVTEIAGLFVFSLVPIAIAYHLAHYLSYLLIAGQLIIPLASDPLGIGWNIFGTAGSSIDIGIVGAKFVWYTAVIAIVVGHVFAVGVAHFVAMRTCKSTGAALKSQYPFLVLMVAYSMVSLWILSQPIIGGPNLGSLRAPSGTVSLAPFELQESCFELATQDEVQYGFQSDLPVEFNVHYHDGSEDPVSRQIDGNHRGHGQVRRGTRPNLLPDVVQPEPCRNVAELSNQRALRTATSAGSTLPVTHPAIQTVWIMGRAHLAGWCPEASRKTSPAEVGAPKCWSSSRPAR